MSSRIYNIAWCDDKVEQLVSDYQDALRENNCLICKKAKNAEELILFLRNNHDKVDGVIVDFNVNERKDVPSNDSEMSGFSLIRSKIRDFQPIPFYLYSAHSANEITNKMSEAGIDVEEDYFMGGENFQRYFTVGQFNRLLEKMCEEIEKNHTPYFDLRQKFSKAFYAFDHFDLDSHSLIKILSLADDAAIGEEVANSLNNMRRQIEKIFLTNFVDKKIFPSDVPLNKVPFVLTGQHAEYRTVDSFMSFMPETMRKAFSFFLEFTQDGSHERREGLSYHVSDYFTNNNDVHLALCLAHICMDIAVWSLSFESAAGNKCPFIKVGDSAQSVQSAIDYNKTSTVMVSGGNKYVQIDGEKCFLQDDRNTPLKEGETIIVKKVAPNTSANKQFATAFPKFISFSDWDRA